MAYDTGVDPIKQRPADAKQRIKEAACTWDQLNKLDRYECRALSRRNRAIKTFDEACAAADRGSATHLTSFWQNEPNESGDTQQSRPPALQ
jgi:hypothetical protein